MRKAGLFMSETLSIKRNVFFPNGAQKERDVVLNCPAACLVFESDDNALILCDGKDSYNADGHAFDFAEKDGHKYRFKRFLLLFLHVPVALENIKHWKDKIYAFNRYADLRIDFLRMGNFDKLYLEGRIARHCVGWNTPKPQPVYKFPELNVSGLITINNEELRDKSSPSLLSVMFGKTGALLQRLHLAAERFKKVKADELVEYFGTDVDAGLRKMRDKIDLLLECKLIEGRDDYERCRKLDAKRLEFESEYENKYGVTRFPKILLCGESGVGKTLLAKSVQNAIMPGVEISRIVIPEYLNKEDSFEFAMFGYKKGAFTGAYIGSHGLLLESIGNVIFLDEIGEASPSIQAKLLAYLDDYRVPSRGWVGKKFYCPTLIIAATNRDLKSMAERGQFRKDLLARFTDIEYIPPLRERLESVDFIIDILLQNDDINPTIKDANKKTGGNGDKKIKRWVNVIEPEALMRLRYQDYREGNFRELEEVLRRACRTVHLDGRDRMRAHDIQPL